MDKNICEKCVHRNVCAFYEPGEECGACNHFADKSRLINWIPAEVMPPKEDDCEYLIVVNGEYSNGEYANGPYATQHFERTVEIAIYSEEDGWILEAYPNWQDPIVTHWMPLPEPPEVES